MVSFAEHFSCVYSRLEKTFPWSVHLPIGFRVEQIVYELQLTVAFVRFGCRLRLSTVADAMGAAMESNGMEIEIEFQFEFEFEFGQGNSPVSRAWAVPFPWPVAP